MSTAISEGAVTPAVITSRLDQARLSQAEAAVVTTFVIPYPLAGPDSAKTHLSDSQTPATTAPPTRPPAGAFLHPNPGMAPTGCPQAAIPGGLPSQTTPDTRSLKTRRQLLPSNVRPEAQAHRRTHPLRPQDAPHRRPGNVRPAKSAGARTWPA